MLAALSLLVLVACAAAALGGGYWRRGRALRRLDTIRRLYGALSSLNALVVRARSSDELLQGACEIAVASGDFALASVRLVDPETKLAPRVALAGTRDATRDRVLDMHEGSPDANTLTGQAYRTGKPVLARGAEVAARMRHDSESRAVGAYPLHRGGECIGVLLLRSAVPDAFGGEIAELLERMAADISHGLQALGAAAEQRRFRVALDSSGDMIVLVDRASLRVVDANTTLCRLLGYSRDEMIGMDPTQFLPHTREELGSAYDELIANPGHIGNLRSHYVCKDGSTLPFESTRRVLREGDRWLVVVISRDTRERDAAERAQRLAEEAAHRKDAFYRALVENVTEAISACDMDWRYVYSSPAVERLYGYDPRKMIGRRFGDTTFPAEAAAVRERLRRALEASDAPQQLRMELRRRDGEMRVNEMLVSKGAGPDGEPIYLVTARDVTERVKADAALAASERRFRALLEHGADGIIVYDREGRILYRTSSTERVTGYTDDDRAGRTLGDLALPEDAAAVRAALATAIAKPGVPQPGRVRARHKDGRLLWLEGTFTSMLDNPAVGGVVANFRDVTARVQTDEALRLREETLRVLADYSPDGIARFDRELRFSYVNPAIVKTTGRPAEWFIGCTVQDRHAPEFAATFNRALRAVLENGETETVEYSYDTPRGVGHFQARLAPERDAAGGIGSIVVISRDITLQKRAEQRIRESESRLRGIVEATPAPLLVVTRRGGIVFANPAAAEVLGRSRETLPGLPLGLPLAGNGPVDVEVVLPGGGARPAEMRIATMQHEASEVLVVSLHDLSERRSYERHIEHLANHDALTGLPNRTLLRDRVEQAIVHARRTQAHIALMFIDLDHFKLVNDSWGHQMGDALLMEVGRRLQKTVRDGDTVGRLGGDEFVILLCDLKTPGDTALVARKIATALAEPLAIGVHNVHATASIGIGLYPGDGEDLDSLLQCADAAMYRAKEAGRNGYQYYSAEMGAQARARIDTEAGLRQALELGELRLHYQPQVALDTGEVRGFEALMRWQNPRRGLVSPASFIPVAEESGLIVPMGQWALRAACQQAAEWAAAGLGRMRIAVNLSARQFWRGGVSDAVRVALAESGIEPGQLELEITESVVARDLHQVMLTLEQLRLMGVSIAIDDFGTGYSSLAYLRSLPIQKLKIDKSFIRGIPDDREATALVGEIVRLAHVLSLEVVAEGVETAAQASFLREAGCEAIQGYLVAHPAPGEDCTPLLRPGRHFSF